uniref:Exonuclease domain-containing protein n=1 Tax=Callorhinchus milii TaxID=7868 RepID=A0A4W3I5P6_CALMI
STAPSAERGSNISKRVRHRYLNFFIEEFLKICSTEQEAFNKAISEEMMIYEHNPARSVYLNVAVSALKKLRNLGNLGSTVSNGFPPEVVLEGQFHNEGPFSIDVILADIFSVLHVLCKTDTALYWLLKEYVLTEEQLKENGYPRENFDKPGVALLFGCDKYYGDREYSVKSFHRITSDYKCIMLYVIIVPGGWEIQYSCCKGSLGSDGCEVLHVCNRKENLEGFMKTFLRLMPLDGNPGVFAVHCEMCYTRHGMEIARVSVVNSSFEVVYDTFVKQDNEVIDYNTRFSGVTQKDLANAKQTLREVQAVLLSMFSADSIIIGHCLENDLFALKIIHSTIIDTSIVFPHHLGLPHKRAFRNIVAEYLRHIIHEKGNHDSIGDARECVELMIWKVKEDAKGKRQ